MSDLFFKVLTAPTNPTNYERFIPKTKADIRTAIKNCPKGWLPMPFKVPSGKATRTIGVAYYSVK